MWGKSLQYCQVTDDMGKPYGLKDQIYPETLCRKGQKLPAFSGGVGRMSQMATSELDK